jgi:hypothetical protein
MLQVVHACCCCCCCCAADVDSYADGGESAHTTLMLTLSRRYPRLASGPRMSGLHGVGPQQVLPHSRWWCRHHSRNTCRDETVVVMIKPCRYSDLLLLALALSINSMHMWDRRTNTA